MRLVLDALIPVFALIVVGYGLRRSLLPDPRFWAGASQLSYFVLLPALLVNQLAGATLRADLFTTLWGVAGGAILLVALLVWLTKHWTTNSNGAFTSVLQGSIRPNTYIALALPAALFGQEGLVYTAITLAATVPLVSILSVMALVRYQGDEQRRGDGGLRSMIHSLLHNPLIVACAIGIGLNRSGLGVPIDLAHVLIALTQAALPIGLLTVGAGLDLTTLQTAVRPLVSATLVKLVLSPAVALLLCRLLDVTPLLTGVCTILLALPCATASYILAERMGGDFRLMAGILTVQTLAAGITLPLLLLWLQ